MRVRFVLRSLVHRLGLGDDPVGPDLPDLRHLGADDDQVVELEVLLFFQDDAELRRRRVLGSEHTTDATLAHEAIRSCTASRSARYTSPGSPMRSRSCRSRAAIGTGIRGGRGTRWGLDANSARTRAV